jgi:phosphatidylglycerophosphatase A
LPKWIVTFFGAGLSPIAPGTVGSLLATVLLYAAFLLAGGPVFFTWQVILIIALAVFCALSVGFGPWAVACFGKKDPQPFVLDEVAGICLTNLLLPVSTDWHEAIILAVAFLVFRVFDIAKPPPARQLETLPLGWGILLDDLAAAVYANLVCQILFRVLLWRIVVG